MNKRILPILFFSLLIGTFIYGVCISIYRIKKLSSNTRYTIAIPYEYFVAHFKFGYRYKFRFHDKFYNGVYKYTDKKPNNVIGKRFYVFFSVEDPDVSELLFDHEGPNDSLVIPENGWDEISQ